MAAAEKSWQDMAAPTPNDKNWAATGSELAEAFGKLDKVRWLPPSLPPASARLLHDDHRHLHYDHHHRHRHRASCTL